MNTVAPKGDKPNPLPIPRDSAAEDARHRHIVQKEAVNIKRAGCENESRITQKNIDSKPKDRLLRVESRSTSGALTALRYSSETLLRAIYSCTTPTDAATSLIASMDLLPVIGNAPFGRV